MTLRSSPVRLFVTAAVAAAAVAAATRSGEAHKPITSKYTYNDDVFPILRDKCGRCHVEGGVAPMSLMTYEEAFPWAESIRAELIASHMPPWNADEGFGELRRVHRLTAKEVDVILTWATGGNPRGALDQKVPRVTLKNEWTLGAPDLTRPLSEFTLAADRMEDTKEFTIATGTSEPRFVRAVDLLPGTPAIVRSAIVALKAAGAAAPEPERVLARWLPGHDPDAIESGVAFRLPAGADLTVRIHYRKTWQFEGKALTDRSTVGVYFAPEKGAQELLALPVDAPAGAAPGGETLAFSQTIDRDVQVLALAPDQVPPNITLQVQAVRPDGSRAPMIRLNTRADWVRRYWFEKPLSLPRGSKIEVVANLGDPDLLSAAFSVSAAPKPPPPALPMRLALDVIPGTAKPAAP